ENCDQFTPRDFQTFVQGPRLETMPVLAMQVDNRKTLPLTLSNYGFGDFLGFVSGIVEQLNFHAVARVIQGTNLFDKAFDDILFIVDRELNGDEGNSRHLFKRRNFARQVVFIFIIKIGEVITMKPEDGQKPKDQKIKTEQEK